MVFAFSAWLCWSSDLIKEVHRRKKPAHPKKNKRHILHFFSFLQIKVAKKIVTGRTWSTRVGGSLSGALPRPPGGSGFLLLEHVPCKADLQLVHLLIET